MTEPNSANPTIRPIPLVIENTLLRNRDGGSTGSGTWRSIATNATVSTTAAQNRPMISHESHG